MKENKYWINKAQQEIIKGKWFSFGATEHTKGKSTGYTPKLLLNNRYYGRLRTESLEIHMEIARAWRLKKMTM